MKTLREMGMFVGIPEDSGEFGTPLPISLGYVRHLLTGAPLGQSPRETYPFSFQEAIQQLEGLPPIKLDAAVVGSSEGYEPFAPLIRIGQSPGLVLFTRIYYESGGRLFSVSDNVRGGGGDIGGLTLGPGLWKLTVRRSGISTTGYEKLERSLNLRTLQRQAPVNPPQENNTRPTIAVTPKVENEQVTFTITGYGFLHDQPGNWQGIAIRIVDGTAPLENRSPYLYTSSNGAGNIGLNIGPIEFWRISVNPLSQKREVRISATDKRTDPHSVPANEPLWSNTVAIAF